jgi:hypothetical protein
LEKTHKLCRGPCIEHLVSTSPVVFEKKTEIQYARQLPNMTMSQENSKYFFDEMKDHENIKIK